MEREERRLAEAIGMPWPYLGDAAMNERPPRRHDVREHVFWRSFHHAFEGIIYATRTQSNMRLHLIAAALVLAATLYLRLQRPYVIGIVVTVAVVLAFELINTAIEALVDLMTARAPSAGQGRQRRRRPAPCWWWRLPPSSSGT